MVTATVPPSQTVLVVSRGDDTLLRLGSRSGWHFPRTSDGRYAGYYPKNSAEAIKHLEELRARGARYLVFPATSLWWLEHYPDFKDHLDRRYECVVRDDKICAIYALGDDDTHGADEPSAEAAHDEQVDASGEQLASFLDSILPDETILGIIGSGEVALSRLQGRDVWDFHPSEHAPADSKAAVAHLEHLHDEGMEFLVIMREAPMLTHYPEFLETVERRYRCVAYRRHLCAVYDMTGGSPDPGPAGAAGGKAGRRRWLGGRSREADSNRG